MAAHRLLAPDPRYGPAEYAAIPPSNSWIPLMQSPAAQYSPLSPIPPTPYTPAESQYTPSESSAKKGPRIASRSVSSFFSRSSQQAPKYTTQSHPKSRWWHILGHVFSFLWIVPIIALLILNLTNHIIGPSAWCPGGYCPANVWDQNALKRAKHLDENDHNTLGALQLVAKAMEVWFMFIATALIYDLAMILARKEGGLPIGFLLTHLQFTDLRNLFNPSLWTSAIPHRHAPTSQQKSAARLMLFGIFVALLTILANLMGPAAAVLVIPSLRWVETPRVPKRAFTSMDTGKPPVPHLLYSDCTADNLSASEYGCTMGTMSSSLDSFASAALSMEMQYTEPYSIHIPSVSQQSAVQFLVNLTANDSVAWAANRLVLQELSRDLFRLGGETDEGDYTKPATPLNDSLQIVLNRQGPSVGFNHYCRAGEVSVVDVAKDKSIHCFTNWSIDRINNYTKCFRVGEGFNATNKRTNFWFESPDLDSSVNETAVDIFFSDRATLYNAGTDFGSGIRPCLAPSKAPTCDWDAIFSTPMPPEVRNMTENISLTSYSFSPPTSRSTKSSRIYCDSVSYIGFPTYSLDTLPSSNPSSLVKLENLALRPPLNTPIVIDPAWYLAALSVNANGTVPSYRPISRVLGKVLPDAFTADADPSDLFWQTLEWLHLYILTQTMSIIPYDATNITSTSSSPKTSKDPTKPILHTWSTRHVWAYGINESRTSKLGLTVVSLGVLCVLFRLILGLTLGKREHSPVELFVAALEHQPTGEFEHVGRKGRGKVRYVLEEDEIEGKVRFVPERSYTGGFEKSRTFNWRRGTFGFGGNGSGGGDGMGTPLVGRPG